MKKSTDIRKLKNLKKPVRYSIPNCVGLHLWVRSDLKKYWVFRYTYQGKRYDTSLGSFPDVTLADARKKHQKLRGLLLNGINPFDEKNSQNNEEIRRNNAIKFAKFAEAYIERMSPKWSNKIHAMQWMTTIKSYANPVIGNMSLEQITTDHILQVLTPIWITRHATAMRLRGRIERVMSAAITSGLRTKSNPAVWRGHLENLLPILKPSEKHFPAAPYKEVPLMMKQLREDHCVASLLLQFIILNASRSGEASHARRSEISQDLWIIPAERIKARSEHVVPLTSTSIALIDKARKLDPNSEFLFSENGKPLYGLKILIKAKSLMSNITVHGFRSSFRDWVAEETTHSPEVAEMSLAHKILNKVEAAYRRGKLLERRKLLLADWETYCLSACEPSTKS